MAQTTANNEDTKEARVKLNAAAKFHFIHWFVIALSILLSLGAWYFAKEQLNQKIESEFNRQAEQAISLIKERMGLYESALWGGVALINSNQDKMSYPQWLVYADSLKIDQTYPGINGIGVIYNVQASQLEEYLEYERKFRPTYKLHPQRDEDEYWPITYIEPAAVNKQAIGLDVAFEENRYTAIKKARDTGTTQLTGPISLVQDAKKTPGFLFYTPFYENGVTPKTIEGRRENILGVTYAPFIMNKLMQGTLATQNRQVGIKITDAGQLLYDDEKDNQEHDKDPLLQKHVDIELYGRIWSFDIQSDLKFREASNVNQPTFILIAGIIINIMLFSVFLVLNRSNQETKKLAEHDSLTGLANRYLFDETLMHSIAGHRRTDSLLALILMDLDHFKYINDNYGHDVGDELLTKVTERIHSCLRGNELFARLGGDEFAITLTSLPSAQDANMVAMRILSALEEPFQIGDIRVTSTASIGISMYPADGDNAKDLFKHADIAMYRAKKLGRNRHSFFEEEMQSKFLANYEIENNLRTSIVNKEFLLFYQPVINMSTMKVSGFEALLRWPRYPEIGPDTFIPIAEKSMLIVELGRWVISEALNQLSLWNESRVDSYSLAINLSPVQLSDPGLVSFIEQSIVQHEIRPELIEFELTETALLVESDLTNNVIQELSNLGCRIALDDFGTGFSSLTHLHSYPIDTVKIDKSIMPSSSNNMRSEQLLSGIVSMIKLLGLDIVAEGVEDKLDLDLCKSLAVEKAQGYYFHRPMKVLDIESSIITSFNNATAHNNKRA